MADIEKQMDRLRQGSLPALEQIYLQTKNAVFSIAFSITKDYQLSEDIMQETYIKVCNNIQRYINGTNATGWIYTITRNLAINAYNKNKRESLTDFSERTDICGKKDIYINDESGIFSIMSQALDDNEYKIVTMHTIGGIKFREIAKLVNKPQGTVRWQYRNALKKIQNKLKIREVTI